MEIFAKFMRTITRVTRRLRPLRGPGSYRPERHYMRGAGPKSKRVAPANGGSTRKAT